jgi:ribonuclease HI
MSRDVALYADGACSPNPGQGGYCAILLDLATMRRKELLGIEPESTNNRAEILAIAVGLEALKPPLGEVHIYSDSQYAIMGGSGRWARKTNHDHWRRLDAAVQRTQAQRVHWHWIRRDEDALQIECDDAAKEMAVW